MDITLMEQGYQLLFYGMGVVFVFLSLLVVCVSVMSLLVNRFFPEPVQIKKPVTMAKVSLSSVNNTPDPHLLKVIAAAVEQHRASKKQ